MGGMSGDSWSQAVNVRVEVEGDSSSLDSSSDKLSELSDSDDDRKGKGN